MRTEVSWLGCSSDIRFSSHGVVVVRGVAAPIPTMVECLNGESSDEDDVEDSSEDSNADNAISNVAFSCTVHSTTARRRPTQLHCVW